MTTSTALQRLYLDPADGDKTVAFNRLTYDLRRQFPEWPSTFSPCVVHGCTDAARGGGLCSECLRDCLSELTGQPALATRLHDALETARDTTADMRDNLDQHPTP